MSDLLYTDSTVYISKHCTFRVDVTEDRAVLRVTGNTTECRLVLAGGVTDRIMPLLRKAMSHSPVSTETRYTVIPVPA